MKVKALVAALFALSLQAVGADVVVRATYEDTYKFYFEAESVSVSEVWKLWPDVKEREKAKYVVIPLQHIPFHNRAVKNLGRTYMCVRRDRWKVYFVEGDVELRFFPALVGAAAQGDEIWFYDFNPLWEAP